MTYFTMPFTAEHSLRCRKDFPALARTPLGLNLAYLDGPAGSQVPQPVIDAFGNFYATCNVNTRGNCPARIDVASSGEVPEGIDHGLRDLTARRAVEIRQVQSKRRARERRKIFEGRGESVQL